MTRAELIAQIKAKQSYLCVGLDTAIDKIPQHLLQKENPVLAFNKAIIDATKDYTVAYKINTAFYEAQGIEGWKIMEETLKYIPKECFTIADAKRGDIGNTSEQYAKTFFETYPYDSVTVAPYMGKDSVSPFLKFEGKWTIVLGLTSNEGGKDFQFSDLTDGDKLYEKVLKTVSSWGTTENLMFVTGATRAEQLEHIRTIVPDHFLLVPGVGAQGGDVASVSKAALNKDCGLLINVSRGIIYARNDENFAIAAKEAAKQYQEEMKAFL
jgi:orotidine-5'-phosphate decarboxylase